jgi:hypothetical protein
MRFSLAAILLVAAVGSGPGQATESPLRLSGSREDQVAQLFAAIIPVGTSRDWAAAQAAFPGARWEPRTSDTTPTVVRDGITYPGALETNGYTDVLDWSIDLDGGRFLIMITGTPERATRIRLDAPEGVRISRTALRRAFAARGVGWRLLRCDPLGDSTAQTIVELAVGGQSAIFQDSFSGEASAYTFAFDGGLYDPADPPGNCGDNEVRDLQ